MSLNYQHEPKTLNQLGQEIWNTCEEKGFHGFVEPEILERALRLMLIVSELGEALEAIRKDDESNHREEIADTMIRLLHYGAHEGIDLDAEVAKKMEKNRGRPYKHGKRF